MKIDFKASESLSDAFFLVGNRLGCIYCETPCMGGYRAFLIIQILDAKVCMTANDCSIPEYVYQFWSSIDAEFVKR